MSHSRSAAAQERLRIIEDAEWIVGTDHPEHIARRVGFATTKQLYDALRRWGRHDLVDRCQQWHVVPRTPATPKPRIYTEEQRERARERARAHYKANREQKLEYARIYHANKRAERLAQ